MLNAERSLFTAELLQAQTKGIIFQSLVNLYKAMGGVRVVEADRMTSGAADPEPTPQGSTEGWEVFRWRLYG